MLLRPLQGEPVIDEYKMLYYATYIPNFIRPTISFILTKILNEQRLGEIVKITHWKTTGEYILVSGR